MRNPYNEQQQEIARCSYCFTPLPQKRGSRMGRKAYVNGEETYGYVCNARCGELWKASVRRDFERMLAYEMSVRV